MSRVLATGALLRSRGPAAGTVALCLNGGTGKIRPGVWGASIEYMVGKLAPRRPDLGFAELRYRVRSWRELDDCIADANAAIDHLLAEGAAEILLVGYSMGGAVASQIADHPRVRRVIGLAPWLPKELSMERFAGRELRVIHGTLDGELPGVPGVSAASSRRGFDRALAAGATGSYTRLAGAIHPIALRAPWGGVIPMPRAREWVRLASGSFPQAP